MSEKETPLTRAYWQQIGGTLIEEFRAVRRSKKDNCGQRLIDGVIILGGPKRIAHWSEVDLEGKDIVVVQTKATRLGMYLMGQTLFSKELMKEFKPKSIKSVALCTKDDTVLRPMLEKFPDVEVVVMKEQAQDTANRGRGTSSL